MIVSRIILYIMTLFFVLGALDRCFGNKFGLGAEFERGFSLMGSTALTIIGLICAAPFIAQVIQPVVVPIYSFLGADAAMFSGAFLSADTGGYAIAAQLAEDPQIALFGGIIVSTMMGATVSFAIPVACGIIEKEDTKYLAAGVLSGFIFDPLACFFGGIAMGLSPIVVLCNLVPVVIFAIFIVLGLFFLPQLMIKAFRALARGLLVVVTLGLILGAVQKMVGLTIIENLTPIEDGFLILGSVVLSLSGALPFAFVLHKILKRPLCAVGKKIGINDVAVLAMVISVTSLVPVFASYKNMNVRGKVVTAAIAASFSNLLGAHLGFTASISQEMIGPMLMAKILAGVFAVPTALFFAKRLFGDEIREQRGRR